MSDPMQCRFCQWWANQYSSGADSVHRSSAYGQNQCRRHAPTRERIDGIDYLRYPLTDAQHWCGDFERFRNPDGQPNRVTHTT